MALYRLLRFEVRPDALEATERALHDYASYVRAELAGTMFTVYRDADVPTRYAALVRDMTTAAVARRPTQRSFDDPIAPVILGTVEPKPCELVTSSDLAPRPKVRRR